MRACIIARSGSRDARYHAKRKVNTAPPMIATYGIHAGKSAGFDGIPPAVMKTASTGWRMASYYLGRRPYEEAGPPPLLMRLLGPLVVVSTLGLLATGVLLILLGEEQARRTSLTVLGFRADWVTAHQGFFAVWCGAVGLHLLGRIVPALRATVLRGPGAERAVPGRWARVLWFAVMVVGAAALAVVLVHADSSWASHGFGDRPGIRPEDG